MLFQYLIVIEPLGLLYGSAGRFLSPENLVGRSGISFPPSAATVSGLYAASLNEEAIASLKIAGLFWACSQQPENFYVPIPFSSLVKQGEIHQLRWYSETQEWLTETGESVSGKFDKGNHWIPINSWHQPEKIYQEPWEFLPHLHPRIELNQRKVDTDSTQGSLFLENAVQMHPDACLIYLSNISLADGWYRFRADMRAN